MFTVTDEAANELKEMLDEAEDRPAGHTFRIGFDESGRLGLVWDVPDQNDHQIQVEDETVLLVSADVAASLQEVVMDIVETDDGTRLTLYQRTD